MGFYESTWWKTGKSAPSDSKFLRRCSVLHVILHPLIQVVSCFLLLILIFFTFWKMKETFTSAIFLGCHWNMCFYLCVFPQSWSWKENLQKKDKTLSNNFVMLESKSFVLEMESNKIDTNMGMKWNEYQNGN